MHCDHSNHISLPRNGPPYPWEGDEAAKQARIEKYQKVDMTTDIGHVHSTLHKVDGGRMLHHAQVLVDTIRQNVSEPEGMLAIAMVEAPGFEAMVIASIFDEILPKETVQYFRTTNEHLWKIKEPMCKIFRPYMFDDDDLYDYDEMKALGIPTWLEVIEHDFGVNITGTNVPPSNQA